MSDVWLLRTGILIAGLLLIVAIYILGRPRKPGQGRRIDTGRGEGGRVEPTLGEQIERELADGADLDAAAEQAELDLLDGTTPAARTGLQANTLGRRESEEFDKIVTLYIAARAGEKLHGPDIVVAAEKAGLAYGHMNVFHRLVEGHPERGPVFSVANIMKPGSFHMSTIQSLETP